MINCPGTEFILNDEMVSLATILNDFDAGLVFSYIYTLAAVKVILQAVGKFFNYELGGDSPVLAMTW